MGSNQLPSSSRVHYHQCYPPIVPSLHPHALSRVVRCLCPTDFYTEWSTYRTLLFTPLMALRHCGEWATTSVVRGKPCKATSPLLHSVLTLLVTVVQVQFVVLPSYTYIIPHLSGFVKGFAKIFQFLGSTPSPSVASHYGYRGEIYWNCPP